MPTVLLTLLALMQQRLKCCIVYGGLPPDARQKQARLFNGKIIPLETAR